MRTVFVLFDSLNRLSLSTYSGAAVATPNFDRLASRCVTFDRHYVGSMPCMPARRDMVSGRLSFLHRSWGPIEPFDNAFPEMLAKAGTYSHLVTDHAHYFEDGGATYHNRYDSYEFIRGQESDRWKAKVAPDWERLSKVYHPAQFATTARSSKRHNIVNREYLREEQDFPARQCFARGIEFLEENCEADDWLLQIETFDPHEPFTAPERLRKRFDTGWQGPTLDWPPYGRVEQTADESDELRANYRALIAHCDELLGNLLDYFDRYDLWKDTALIVTTDHGFLLGEHDFWAKNRMHLYEEIAHIPLFLHDPRRPDLSGTRCDALTQSIDIAPTVLELHDVSAAPEMQGYPLARLRDGDAERQAALFGYFGGAVNVTDGRYVLFLFPEDLASQEIYQYTLMPTHIYELFSVEELAAAELSDGFGFTKGVKLLKIPVIDRSPFFTRYGPGALIESDTRLYDVVSDPRQQTPIEDATIGERLMRLMRDLMIENEAPPEAFARIGLLAPMASR